MDRPAVRRTQLPGNDRADREQVAASDRLADARIVRAIAYLKANMDTAINVADLAAEARMSPSHFARLFRVTTGQSVWRYVLHLRCERARDLLLATELSVAEIGYRCGFSSQAHLTTTFRRRFGITPSKARQAWRR